MADPDEALIEAIAEAIINADPPEGVTPRRTEAWMVEARAAYAAMVAHLGLVEETIPAGCWARGSKPMRRLVSRWTEVDHGCE